MTEETNKAVAAVAAPESKSAILVSGTPNLVR